MLFRMFFNAIALVALLALAAHFLGTGIVDAGVHHVTGAIDEIGSIAKQLANDGSAGQLGKKMMAWVGL